MAYLVVGHPATPHPTHTGGGPHGGVMPHPAPPFGIPDEKRAISNIPCTCAKRIPDFIDDIIEQEILLLHYLHCVSKNVPSLTGYNFNTYPPIFLQFLAHVASEHSKIGYRQSFLNYLVY